MAFIVHGMSFKKPFRAVPVKLGPHYRAKQRRERIQREAKFLLLVGTLSAAVFIWVWTSGSVNTASSVAAPARSSSSVYYSGCQAARAAGAAPIYAGQPGYREELDGDGDGIACEPHRGW